MISLHSSNLISEIWVFFVDTNHMLEAGQIFLIEILGYFAGIAGPAVWESFSWCWPGQWSGCRDGSRVNTDQVKPPPSTATYLVIAELSLLRRPLSKQQLSNGVIIEYVRTARQSTDEWNFKHSACHQLQAFCLSVSVMGLPLTELTVSSSVSAGFISIFPKLLEKFPNIRRAQAIPSFCWSRSPTLGRDTDI